MAGITFLFAGKHFLDLEIDPTLHNLWTYMGTMYNLDAFTQSCPADQDIINHYKLQQVGLHCSKTHTNLRIKSLLKTVDDLEFRLFLTPGREDEEARRTRDADVHNVDTDRRQPLIAL